MEDELSHLNLRKKEASAESRFHLPDVALELQGTVLLNPELRELQKGHWFKEFELAAHELYG